MKTNSKKIIDAVKKLKKLSKERLENEKIEEHLRKLIKDALGVGSWTAGNIDFEIMQDRKEWFDRNLIVEKLGIRAVKQFIRSKLCKIIRFS